MKRAFILLLDSFGIGASLDAVKYGDEGSDTFGHIVEQCAQGKADSDLRHGPLKIPNLLRLGLAHAALASSAKRLPNINYGDLESPFPQSKFGYAVEQSLGKDSPSGHWEIAGLPVLFDWGYFPPEYPSFPDELITKFIQQGSLPGILGNKHASGTEIIEEFGAEHIKTGKPIVYTSSDSVFQIAAHEEHFGLEKLYQLCDIARKLVDPYRIGRVIARPFVGEPGNFKRTANRRDISTPPHQKTVLDYLVDAGGHVISLGKPADLFANHGISEKIKTINNHDLFNKLLERTPTMGNKNLLFANFVDFDSAYGHRRDVVGYAKALEDFDKRLPQFEKLMQPGDIAIITADHGCDPTWKGSDHTREHIPVLVFGPDIKPEFIGRRDTFADIGQSLAHYFELKMMAFGNNFL